jgi:hypothetical protein
LGADPDRRVLALHSRLLAERPRAGRIVETAGGHASCLTCPAALDLSPPITEGGVTRMGRDAPSCGGGSGLVLESGPKGRARLNNY